MTARRNLRSSHIVPHFARALDLVREGKTMADARRFDDALPLYKLALSHLAESHDERTPALRLRVTQVIAFLEGRVRVHVPADGTPTLAKTEPDDMYLDEIFPPKRERARQEDEIEAARKKGSTGS